MPFMVGNVITKFKTVADAEEAYEITYIGANDLKACSLDNLFILQAATHMDCSLTLYFILSDNNSAHWFLYFSSFYCIIMYYHITL